MKRAALILGIFGGLVILISMLHPAPPPPEQKPAAVVGYVEILSESSWRDSMSNSIRESALNRGIQLLTLKCDRTQDAQIQALRSLITYQVDVIVFTPVVASNWDNVLEEAATAGIPVILVERTIKSANGTRTATFIGSDCKLQGEKAAMQLMTAFGNHDEQVQIVELLGTVGSSNTIDRSGGIRSLLSKSNRYNIIYSVNCDFMFSKAKETFRIYLRNDRRPDALIAHNDAMALGAIEAMKELGLKPGKDILIISFGGHSQDSLKALGQGEIFSIVESNPNVGPSVMDTVEILLRGEVPHDIILEEQIFVTEANPTRDY